MNRSLKTGLLLLAAAGMSTLASCASHITAEQLAEMKRLRQQEQTLNQQIRMKEDEKSRLQSELNSRRAELDRCNTTKQFVEGKLAQWPNVWPDWNDAPPPAPNPVESKPRR